MSARVSWHPLGSLGLCRMAGSCHGLHWAAQAEGAEATGP